ncbi:hypothetical protein [Gracilibacillus xinjiangensis]|uniref:Uncharacterized protein n=1 Tax=Gracilibacillus xinjiangensis TaxID=1193282 RepID=A0ABV8WXD0_9BACI
MIPLIEYVDFIILSQLVINGIAVIPVCESGTDMSIFYEPVNYAGNTVKIRHFTRKK